MRIAFVAIKPSVARRALLPQIRAANGLIRQYAASEDGGTYLNEFEPMLGKHGQPRAQWLIGDRLPMSREGYAL
ncbi:MAG: hypothetical protein ABI268_09405 [Rhodanobacter sp.]